MKKIQCAICLTLVALIALLMTACGTTDLVIKLSDEEIPTLYAVVGERKITQSSAQIATTLRYVEKTYAKAAVSEDDLLTYLDYLMKEEGFTVVVYNLDNGTLNSIFGSNLLAQLTKDVGVQHLAVEIYNTDDNAIRIFYGLSSEPWNTDS